jgi:nitrate/nitrite transporter NarK
VVASSVWVKRAPEPTPPSGPSRPAFSPAPRAAGGIAFINSIGNLGGFVGPYAIGWIKDATGETTLGLVVLAAGPIMAGVVTFLMGHDSKNRDGR